MPDAGPIWLDAEIVIELNRQVLRISDEAPGVRGGTRLEAALMRPKAQYLYSGVRSDPHLAAHYAEAITGKHVFRGGNERTALAAAAVFLRLNDLDIEATLPPTGPSKPFDDEAFEHVVALSTGEIDVDAFGVYRGDRRRRIRRLARFIDPAAVTRLPYSGKGVAETIVQLDPAPRRSSRV